MAVFRYVLLLLIFVTLAFAAMIIYPQYRRHSEAREEFRNASRTFEEKRREYEQRRVWRDGLQNDPAVVERYARENLGYSAEGEHVTNVVEP